MLGIHVQSMSYNVSTKAPVIVLAPDDETVSGCLLIWTGEAEGATILSKLSGENSDEAFPIDLTTNIIEALDGKVTSVQIHGL